MTRKLRTIALGAVAIAAVILITTGPVVGQVWFQAANAQITPIQHTKVVEKYQELPFVWCQPSVGIGITNFYSKCHPVSKGGL